MQVRDVFVKVLSSRNSQHRRKCADVVADRPELRMSAAAQARAKFRVRSPQGWTFARGGAKVRIEEAPKYIASSATIRVKRLRPQMSVVCILKFMDCGSTEHETV